jgi:superfamily II DNA helicase RecQ
MTDPFPNCALPSNNTRVNKRASLHTNAIKEYTSTEMNTFKTKMQQVREEMFDQLRRIAKNSTTVPGRHSHYRCHHCHHHCHQCHHLTETGQWRNFNEKTVKPVSHLSNIRSLQALERSNERSSSTTIRSKMFEMLEKCPKNVRKPLEKCSWIWSWICSKSLINTVAWSLTLVLLHTVIS